MTFPYEPGWRDQDTSRAAATLVRPKAPAMLIQILELFAEVGSASPEQLHAMLTARGERVLLTSVRARVCQLHKQGRLVDSGERALGESGRAKVIVWRLVAPDQQAISSNDSEGKEVAVNIRGD